MKCTSEDSEKQKKHNVNQWTHNINNNKKFGPLCFDPPSLIMENKKFSRYRKSEKKERKTMKNMRKLKIHGCYNVLFLFACSDEKYFTVFFSISSSTEFFVFFFTKRKQKVVQFNEKRQQNKLFFYFRFSTKDLLIHFIGGGSHFFFFLKWINILGKHGTYTNNNNKENENENGEAAKIKQTNMVNVCVTKLVNKQTMKNLVDTLMMMMDTKTCRCNFFF